MTVHPHAANREPRTDHFPMDLSYALARGRGRKGDKGIEKRRKEDGQREREKEREREQKGMAIPQLYTYCGKLLSTASVI